MTAKDDAHRPQRIDRSMFFLWLVMGIGFIASMLHLGSPMRAFNSLNRLGVFCGRRWLLAVLKKLPPEYRPGIASGRRWASS